MAFETGTETLVCPTCSAKHVALWSRMPLKELATIHCQACGVIVHQSNTVRDYFEVLLAQ